MTTNNVRKNLRNAYSHNDTHIAYTKRALVDWHCSEPGCQGWDECTAVYNPKAKTLAVECTLCHRKVKGALF